MRRSLEALAVACFASGAVACSNDDPPSCIAPPEGLPTDVFCIGLYAGHDAAKIASGVEPYTPGVVLWSDGAEKQRYLSLPAGSVIDTSNLDAWSFPVGTKAFKEFRVDGVLVETRLLSKRASGTWDAGTYVWDDTGNATLNTDPHGIVLPSGYEIPTQKDCDKCHHGGADELLGVEAVALGLPNATGLTLGALAERGELSAPPAMTVVSLPNDATGKAGAALGFLHANCGMPCHSSRGLGEETQLRMRLLASEVFPNVVDASATDTFAATVGQDITTASVASHFPGAKRITRGAHEQSAIWLMAHVRGNYQMPPLVSHAVDVAGTQQLADWIDAL